MNEGTEKKPARTSAEPSALPPPLAAPLAEPPPAPLDEDDDPLGPGPETALWW